MSTYKKHIYIYIYKYDGAILEYANVLNQVSGKATVFHKSTVYIHHNKNVLELRIG